MTTAPGGIEAATLERLAQAARALGGPRVRALHLPPARPADALAGESCAVELDDGSLGLSYALFDDTLDRLRERAEGLVGMAGLALAQGLAPSAGSDRGLARTLGLAAANALTAALWRRAGWAPPTATDSLAGLDPRLGERIGMVGLFAPLVPRIRERGAELVVIELRAELQGTHEGVPVTGDPTVLSDCTQILATGTVLLNGTLEGLLAHARRATRFVLIGPSAALLPDALFERGVTALGGSWIVDRAGFVAALRAGNRRGPTARKFVLERSAYPGLPALLARC
jgi:uncharacterized protein (DUF4213/DUF364 family)